MRCTICQHPQQQEIALSLLRDGIRDTARRFQVSRSALDRHKKHLPHTLVKAHEVQQVADSSSLLSQIKELIVDLRNIAVRAEAARQWSQATGALREVRACLELLVKLENELRRTNERPNVVSSPQRSPEEITKNLKEITARIRQRIALEQSTALTPVPAPTNQSPGANPNNGKPVSVSTETSCV